MRYTLRTTYGLGHAALLRKAAERNYTRADDGKFSETAGGGGAKKPAPKPKRKPKATPEERAKAKAAEQEANRAAVYDKLQIGGEGRDALAALTAGDQPDPKAAEGLAAAGLAVKDSAGNYRLTPQGKALIRAASRGDAGEAGGAISEGRDQAAARGERASRKKPKPASPERRKQIEDAIKFLVIDADRLAKAGDDERVVFGIASTDTPDEQAGVWKGQAYDGDLVAPEAMKAALDDYLTWGNVREMHGDTAAGVALSAETIGGTTYLVAKVADDSAWAKVRAGVYKGFSIGGRVIEAVLRKLADGRVIRVITKLLLTEISLVDRPANPDAAILIAKRSDMEDETPKGESVDALAELAKAGETLAKATDPMKVVQQIQQLRNDAELAGDLEGAERYTQAIGLLLVGAGEADPPADDETEVETEVETEETVEMAADETEAEPVMMAAKAEVKKAGRKISGARMAVFKKSAMDLLKILAEAGDADADAMLKALGSASQERAYKAVSADLRKMLQPVAEAILAQRETLAAVQQQVAAIAQQPVSGGPAMRYAGQPVAKALSTQPAPAQPAKKADDPYVTQLRRLVATETHPGRRAQYEAELQKLAS